MQTIDQACGFRPGCDAGPDRLIAQAQAEKAITEADTLLLTGPNSRRVDYRAPVIESILTHVAAAFRWR